MKKTKFFSYKADRGNMTISVDELVSELEKTINDIIIIQDANGKMIFQPGIKDVMATKFSVLRDVLFKERGERFERVSMKYESEGIIIHCPCGRKTKLYNFSFAALRYAKNGEQE